MSQVISKDLQLWLKLHVLLEFLEPLSYRSLVIFPNCVKLYSTHAYLKMRKDSRMPLCRFLESVCFIASFSQNSAMGNTAGFWFQPLPTVQKGKSSQAMAGCLTELGKHRLGLRGVRWMVVLGQSYRKEGTI